MRKSNSLLTITTMIVLLTAHGVKAQSSKGNGALANRRLNNTDFLGWDNGAGTVAGPLQIRNDIPNQPINFWTNGVQRMRVAAAGRVGIGTNNPSSNLFVNGTPLNTGDVFGTDCPAGQNSNWRMFRGTTQYGRIFSNSANTHFQIESSVGF